MKKIGKKWTCMTLVLMFLLALTGCVEEEPIDPGYTYDAEDERYPYTTLPYYHTEENKKN